MENLSNSERQYAEAVKQSIKGGRINGAFRMSLIKKGRELAISADRCSEIEKQILSECSVDIQPVATHGSQTAEREERKRLADLERKQEEARREAQRLDEARRRAEDQAKHEREMAEEARKRREEEERKDRERREAEHKRQMEEQERIHKEAEKAAAMKADAERAKREAAEAKAAAELAKKDAELKAQRAETDRLRAQQAAASAKSPQKRWVFILLGIFFGYLGVHLAYARRWILFAIFWAAFIGFASNCGDTEKASSGDDKAATEESQPAKKNSGNDAIAIPCCLVVAGFWLVAPFCIKKDGKKRRLA